MYIYKKYLTRFSYLYRGKISVSAERQFLVESDALCFYESEVSLV